MPGDTLLLEYYPSGDALYIFVVSKESFSIRKVEVARERLYAIIREVREAMLQSDRKSASYQKNRSLLYGFLLSPVRDEIKKKDQIEIIPAGLLWYVPLETLGDDNSPCLIEEKNVGYLYSSDILRLLAGRRDSGKGSLVAFGNPQGANLPLTEKEVESIAAIFPGSRVFIGGAATKERFLKEAPGSTLLHITSHSSLNREDINKSYIQFGDSPLTLGEVYGLQMPGASLVVLSSCESAMGEDNPGREFASLASAFTIAGASSVVASLWKVEDSSTALLFDEFYKNLKQGHTKAGARQAKLTLMKNPDTSHPFYWAGFILLGDWR